MMTESIHILEDELELRNYLINFFTSKGFKVSTTSTYSAFLDHLKSNDSYSTLILDRMIQDVDTAEKINEIKLLRPDVKILILSAINSAEERAKIITLGADDYVGKPFSSDELFARVKSLIRQNQTFQSQVTFSGITFDLTTLTAKYQDKFIAATPKEFSLLLLMAKEPGKIFSKENLLEHIWGYQADINTNIVETTINSLRKKLSTVNESFKIRNTRFVGYWFEV